jgi:amidase/aspartyl-tRNA(Asn)/glutamyl-tRNA(Gln) amidotransferase subunit A
MKRIGTFTRVPAWMGLCTLVTIGTFGADMQAGHAPWDGVVVEAAQQGTIDVTSLTLADIQAGYARNLFTAEQLVQAYLNHIAQYEPAYNAFTFINPLALDQAREIDRLKKAGRKLGPLAGVPVVIKESMDVVGFPSTAGWAPLSSLTGGVDLFPAQNATVVQRLLDAGAIIIGKTNIPAWSDDGTRANSSWNGPTYNAVDRELAPGASSSGTATAVAASFVPVGLAEETGGSIQNPAGAQSLVGIKPTFGLVPTTGVVPLGGSTRDVVGPIATNVVDAALVLDAIAGYSPDDPKTAMSIGHIPARGYTSQLRKTALKGKRIGLYGPGWRSTNLSPQTQALYNRAITELTAQGAIVVTDPFAGSGFAELALPNEPYDFRGTESAAYDLTQYLQRLGVPSLDALRQLIGVSPFDEGQPLRWYVEVLPVLAASLQNPSAAPDLSEFAALRDAYLAVFNQVMAAHNLDALVFPQTTESIPELFSGDFISETTVSAINIAGLPAVTVPGGQYANGAPFSLIFVGQRWSEAELLGFAYAYEQATHYRIVPELVTGDSMSVSR